MIRVIVSYGSGDRKAPVIDDELICDMASATIRAKQELAEYMYIHMSRTLEMPHDPSAGIGGDFTGEFAFQTLGIYGNHIITERTMTFSPDSAKDSVTMEQYREMVL